MILSTFFCRLSLDRWVSHVMPEIIKAKFDEACPSWKRGINWASR